MLSIVFSADPLTKMAIESSVSQRFRVKSSKNKKKTWRKLDIKDVEEFEIEKRTDAIIGFSSNKPDEELYAIDKEASGGQKRKNLTSRRVNWKDRPLKCFRILQPSSCVPPPVIPNVVGRKQLLKRLKRNNEHKKKRGPKRRLEIERNVLLNAKKAAEEKKSPEDFVGTYDLWASNAEEKKEEDGDSKSKIVIKEKVKVPKTYYNKSSGLPPVEFPDAGASYNPSFTDYKTLLHKAHSVERKKLNKNLALHKKFQRTFSSVGRSNTDSWLVEMSQGILDCGNESNEDIEDDKDNSNARLSINPPVRADKKKSSAQRRKEANRRKVAMELKQQKMEAIREADFSRLRSLKRKILQEERKYRDALLLKKQKRREKALYGTVATSHKYTSPDTEVILTSELSDSLRGLKTDGDLLVDRFKSLQRRNIIVPPCERRGKPPKAKMKDYVKNDCKSFV